MSSIFVQPLGGLGEIGLNCMVVEYEGDLILIDCGLLFPQLSAFGVEFGVPPFDLLVRKKDKIRAILLTHGHEDHIGALPFLFHRGIRAPVYASPFTSLMLRERFREQGLLSQLDLQTFDPGVLLSLGNFQIQTISVNHSIVDSVAFWIQTPIGSLLHTGDFKMDAEPFLGAKTDESWFRKIGEQGLLLLMSDSTNVEKHSHNLEEKVLFQRFEELFLSAEGLVLVSLFSSNISRLAQIFELARKLGKKIALTGRSLDQNVQLSEEAGYLNPEKDLLISLEEISNYSRKDVILLCTGSQGEPHSSLVRIASGSHGKFQIEPGDLVLMSSRVIPGNEKAIGHMINQLFQRGAQVLYEAIHEIHASGHANRSELKQMMEWTKPRFFIPIHGEYRHLIRHAELAEEVGIPTQNILVAVDGDLIELTPNHCKILSHEELPPQWMESREGRVLTRPSLKERKQLAEAGVLVVVVQVHSSGLEFEVLSRGIEEKISWDWRGKLVQALSRWSLKKKKGHGLEEEVRLEVRRLFKQWFDQKPTVLVVLETASSVKHPHPLRRKK